MFKFKADLLEMIPAENEAWFLDSFNMQLNKHIQQDIKMQLMSLKSALSIKLNDLISISQVKGYLAAYQYK